MNIKLPIIASLAAVILAQGGCFDTAMRGMEQKSMEATERSQIDTLLDRTPEAPEPTIDDTTWGSVYINEKFDPIEDNKGTHDYEGVAFSNTSTCLPADLVTTTFEFKDDTVSDGSFTYTKTAENTYTRFFVGYRLELEGGVESKVDTDNYSVIVFTPGGYRLENYTDVEPGEGAPACYYEFTRLD
jgi:hypothetical protein